MGSQIYELMDIRIKSYRLPDRHGYKIVIAHGLGLLLEYNYSASASLQPRSYYIMATILVGL